MFAIITKGNDFRGFLFASLLKQDLFGRALSALSLLLREIPLEDGGEYDRGACLESLAIHLKSQDAIRFVQPNQLFPL